MGQEEWHWLMAALKKTPRVQWDLDEFWDYIANDSIAAAAWMMRRIESG